MPDRFDLPGPIKTHFHAAYDQLAALMKDDVVLQALKSLYQAEELEIFAGRLLKTRIPTATFQVSDTNRRLLELVARGAGEDLLFRRGLAFYRDRGQRRPTTMSWDEWLSRSRSHNREATPDETELVIELVEPRPEFRKSRIRERLAELGLSYEEWAQKARRGKDDGHQVDADRGRRSDEAKSKTGYEGSELKNSKNGEGRTPGAIFEFLSSDPYLP